MKILHKLTTLPTKPITHKIGGLGGEDDEGVEFKFYPVSVRLILSREVSEILSPIMGAVSTLMEPKGRDSKVIEEYSPDGTMARQTDAISPEMAQFRTEKKEKALNGALETIFRGETRLKVGKLIMASLRDDCPDDPSDEDVEAFVNHQNMDMAVFGEFFQGFLKANTTVFGGRFGDLGNLIRERVKQVIDRASSTPSLSDTSQDPQTDDVSENENDSSAPTDEGAVPPTSTAS